jgi:MiaB/RimO family radical SAM methylthiotransferase
MKIAKREGIKEFWLTGQDISCYGFDIDFSLPELLEKILNEIEGKYFIRLGMMNPNHLKKIIDPLLEVCKDERIFKFFHIPVQSGSERILKEMNRNYRVKDFKEIVDKIRKKFPKATIWTDVIVGYPDESNEDFEKTLKLIKRIKPDWVNVSKLYPMKKTKIDSKLIRTKIGKERSRIVSKLVEDISTKNNNKWNYWEGEILVDGSKMGRNFAYKAIHLKNSKKYIGKFLKVKTKIKDLKIYGEIIN